MTDTPIRTLEKQKSKTIVIWLKSGKQYRGRLEISDMHMNCWLSDTQEIVDGQPSKRLGQALLRGNNILLMQLDITV